MVFRALKAHGESEGGIAMSALAVLESDLLS